MTDLLHARIRLHVVDATLDVDTSPGHVTVFFGPSGSGKTTILRSLAGLDRIDAGRIAWGDEVWDDGRRAVPPRARRTGLLFQDHALFPHMSVADNVAYGLTGLTRDARSPRVHDALVAAHAEHLESRPSVAGLSGGEAQRVALARALAPRPRLLLLDEPLSALDAPTRVALRADLRKILIREGMPSIVVTHDRSEALALGDSVAVLIDGVVRQVGPVAQVFDRPADADVARVVGIETALPGTVLDVQDGIARVSVGPHSLTAVISEPVTQGDDVYVCIRAEDISLDVGDPHAGTSPRNHIPAIVTDVLGEGALVRVTLDAGIHLTSTITRPSAAELGIAPGLGLTAVIKSTAVHLIPR
ncbi:MAG: hypothetical protein RL347_756 [Actinomycetota bacterium]|jgi:molybdate transport system ATP-binding protein